MLIIHKKWGKEEIIETNTLYCGKILHLDIWKQCSYHYHKIKDETFYVLEGEVYLNIEGKDMVLDQGESIRILPEQKHSFAGLTEAKIFEFSTTDRATDSYREPGRKSKELNDEEIRQITRLCDNLRRK